MGKRAARAHAALEGTRARSGAVLARVGSARVAAVVRRWCGPAVGEGYWARVGRDVLVLRDPRESWKRCSLAPLRGLAGVRFVAWDPERTYPTEDRLLLDPEGAPLGEADFGRPLLLLDASWRRQPKIRATLTGPIHARRLPPLVTAYPRKSSTYADPKEGLASVEALYAFSALTGRPDPELLSGYRFAAEFLALNADRLPGTAP
jgi:pre-rRNA-processing protein TSR3